MVISRWPPHGGFVRCIKSHSFVLSFVHIHGRALEDRENGGEEYEIMFIFPWWRKMSHFQTTECLVGAFPACFISSLGGAERLTSVGGWLHGVHSVGNTQPHGRRSVANGVVLSHFQTVQCFLGAFPESFICSLGESERLKMDGSQSQGAAAWTNVGDEQGPGVRSSSGWKDVSLFQTFQCLLGAVRQSFLCSLGGSENRPTPAPIGRVRDLAPWDARDAMDEEWRLRRWPVFLGRWPGRVGIRWLIGEYNGRGCTGYTCLFVMDYLVGGCDSIQHWGNQLNLGWPPPGPEKNLSPFQTSQCLLGAGLKNFFSSLGGSGYRPTLTPHGRGRDIAPWGARDIRKVVGCSRWWPDFLGRWPAGIDWSLLMSLNRWKHSRWWPLTCRVNVFYPAIMGGRYQKVRWLVITYSYDRKKRAGGGWKKMSFGGKILSFLYFSRQQGCWSINPKSNIWTSDKLKVWCKSKDENLAVGIVFTCGHYHSRNGAPYRWQFDHITRYGKVPRCGRNLDDFIICQMVQCTPGAAEIWLENSTISLHKVALVVAENRLGLTAT